MFGRKNSKFQYHIAINERDIEKYAAHCKIGSLKEGLYPVDIEVRNYVWALLDYIHDIRFEKHQLEAELKAIKPILENKDYKPAITKDCGDCRYVVRSKYSGDIIGCRKDIVCEDFKEKEE